MDYLNWVEVFMSDFSIREMDSTKAFDGIASVYVKGRPTYAEKFVDDL